MTRFHTLLVSLVFLNAICLRAQSSYVFSQAQFATGTTPSSVAVGDFNGDGRLDLAVTNGGGTTVSVLLGKPDGTFAPKVDYPTGAVPSAIIAADFNGDAKIDLAVVNQVAKTVSILMGNGDGSFQSHIDLPVGLYPISLTAGDFNADGKVDVAIANLGDNTVSILLGNGDGTFQPQALYATGPSPFSVATGDFNKDGKLDLVLATYGSFSITTLQGNGDGTFQAPVEHLVVWPYNPISVVVADLNGDGIPDLAVASTRNGYTGEDYVSVLLGNGDGTFQSAANYTCVRFVFAIAAADFNGDGKPDLFVGNSYENNLSVFTNNGDGTFQPRADYPVGLVPGSVAAGDFNRDGNLDLVAANTQDNNVAVLLGSGNGQFQPHSDYKTGSNPSGLVAADFNSDGHQDLASADCGSNTVSVLMGNGDGTFKARQSFPAGQYPALVTTADLNGDGKIDLVIANQTDSTVSIFLGKGDGTFQPRTDYALAYPYGVTAIGVADFDRDGKPDVVILAAGIGVFSILFGNGDGTLRPHIDYGTGTGIGPTSLVVGDVNGDGTPDLVITSSAYFTGTIALLLGNGDGSFAYRIVISPQQFLSSPVSVAVGDFNGDGKMDITVAEGTYQFGRIDMFFAYGDGSFQFPTQFFKTANGAGPIVTADFNGDGIPDLVVGGGSILLGNGDGTFQTYMDRPKGYAVAADFDGDGRPDLAMVSGPNSISVFLNKPAVAPKPAPAISSISLSSASQGQTIPNLTVTGTNFDPTSSQLSVSPPDGIAVSIQTRNTTQIVASVAIPSTATLGSHNVILTNPDAKQSAPAAFQILGVPAISVSLFPVPFPNTLISVTSTPVEVTITNTGTATLHVNSITLSSAEFTFDAVTQFDVPFGQNKTATFNVFFKPAAAGLRQGTMTIASNGSITPIQIGLQGTGLLPLPDLFVTSVRPVQVVFDSDANGDGIADLVLGKATAFQVRIQASSVEQIPSPLLIPVDLTFDGVSYRMIISRANFGDVVGISEATITFNPRERIIPQTAGLKRITVIVDPDNVLAETDKINNINSSTIVDVKPTGQLRLVYIPIAGCTLPGACYGHPGIQREDAAVTATNANDFVRATYPVSAAGTGLVSSLAGRMDGSPISGNCSLSLRTNSLTLIPDMVSISAAAMLVDPRYSRVIGIVPSDYFDFHGLCGYSGISSKSLNTAIVREGAWTAVAHELGHTYGLPVHPIADNEEYLVNDVTHQGNPASAGFWVDGDVPIPSGARLCFMGTAGLGSAARDSRWIERIDYERLFRQFRADPSDPEVLFVSGILDKADNLISMMSLSSTNGRVDPVEPSDFIMQTLDSEERVISESSLAVPFEWSIEPLGTIETEQAVFAQRLPFATQTFKLRLGHSGKVIADINPFEGLLQSAITAIPNQAFVKNPDERRNALLNKAAAIAHMINEHDFVGARMKLSEDLERALNNWLRNDYEISEATQMTRGQLEATITQVMEHINALASNN